MNNNIIFLYKINITLSEKSKNKQKQAKKQKMNIKLVFFGIIIEKKKISKVINEQKYHFP